VVDEIKERWVSQRERGSPRLIRLIAWIGLRLGRPPARLLLYPITLYFLLFSATSRRASRDYLPRVLGRRATLRDLFRHHHCFAATVLDRLFLLAGQHQRFEVTLHGEEAIAGPLAGGRGCILLGAHLGSFEVLRTLGQARELPVNILMYEKNAAKVNAVFDALNPAMKQRVIPIGQPDSLLAVKECLARGELVGILGDRRVDGEKTVTCRLLGGEVALPAGPVLLASLLHAPVVLCFGIYRGGRRYDLHFETLAERLELPRGQRMEAAAQWMQRYADRIEGQCRRHPFNWFNFYDYWGTADAQQ